MLCLCGHAIPYIVVCSAPTHFHTVIDTLTDTLTLDNDAAD
jgi:hypothetical protein